MEDLASKGSPFKTVMLNCSYRLQVLILASYCSDSKRQLAFYTSYVGMQIQFEKWRAITQKTCHQCFTPWKNKSKCSHPVSVSSMCSRPRNSVCFWEWQGLISCSSRLSIAHNHLHAAYVSICVRKSKAKQKILNFCSKTMFTLERSVKSERPSKKKQSKVRNKVQWKS